MKGEHKKKIYPANISKGIAPVRQQQNLSSLQCTTEASRTAVRSPFPQITSEKIFGVLFFLFSTLRSVYSPLPSL